ncbi:MAG: GUN4 domain-containing protein [Limnospira sp.]
MNRRSFCRHALLGSAGLVVAAGDRAFSVSNGGSNIIAQGDPHARLKTLLNGRQWKDANDETIRIMLEAIGKKRSTSLDQQNLQNFPCDTLKIIDDLWTRYSNWRFGFSRQKQIYLDVGGKLDGKYPGDRIWDDFGRKVGWWDGSWLSYNQLTFDLSAPAGHLPRIRPTQNAQFRYRGALYTLLARECL